MKAKKWKEMAVVSAAYAVLGMVVQGCTPQSTSTGSSSRSLAGSQVTIPYAMPVSAGDSSFVPNSGSNPSGNAGALAPTSSALVCPSGFIKVPGNAEYNQKEFCVAKYEMKKGSNGKPVSEAAGLPWSNQEKPDPRASTTVNLLNAYGDVSKSIDNTINRDSAEKLCQSMGAGYDLISNNEWQTIARNIAAVGSNWSSGQANVGILNTGLYEEVQGYVNMTASSDDQPCFGSRDSCTRNTWARNKRTHVLSNGEVIWDLAGNTGEVVKDLFSFNAYWSTYDQEVDFESFRRAGYFGFDPTKLACKPGVPQMVNTGGNICSINLYDMSVGPISVYSENIELQRSLVSQHQGGSRYPDLNGGSREVKTFGNKTLCDKPVGAPYTYCGFGASSNSYNATVLGFSQVYAKGQTWTRTFTTSELTIENLKKYQSPGTSMMRGKSLFYYNPNVCENPVYWGTSAPNISAQCAQTKAMQGIFQAVPAGTTWEETVYGLPNMRSDKGTSLIGAPMGFRCVYSK